MQVKTVFHPSANDCEMRCVPFPNVGKPFGLGAINFKIIYTTVNIMHTEENALFVFNICTVTQKTHNVDKGWINLDSTLFQLCVSIGSVFRFCGPINSNSVMLND